MLGLGTIINTASIIAGGVAGGLTGNLFDENQQTSIKQACGVSVMFIAIAGAMEGMLAADGSVITSSKAMLVVMCLCIGTIIGELLKIEQGFERFGEWLKAKSGNSEDSRFVSAFVSTSFTVCIGAMAIVGSIQDGILGDPSTLVVKSVLDFIMVAVMTSAMGKGSVFSAIPVFILQGSVTLLSRFISPLMTDLAIEYLSLIGSILIFCVGINLVFGKKVNVANMLPAVVVSVAAALLKL